MFEKIRRKCKNLCFAKIQHRLNTFVKMLFCPPTLVMLHDHTQSGLYLVSPSSIFTIKPSRIQAAGPVASFLLINLSITSNKQA